MSAPWVTPSAGREMTCLEPYLANGGGRPQPPDPTKHVLHPLILTSTLVQVLSVQNSCGHMLLSTYKRSSCSWASPPYMPLRSLSSVPASGTSIATKQQRARPLSAQELSDPGSQPCYSLLSPQQGLSLWRVKTWLSVLWHPQKPGHFHPGFSSKLDTSALVFSGGPGPGFSLNI